MAGKHEPPIQRTLLRVATSTLRAFILAALVVLGIIGLTRLFPQNASLGVAGPGGTSTVTPTPTAQQTASPTPTATRRARVRGVVVLVLNGTTTKGLAAEVSATLRNAGYKLKVPGNARATRRTTVYYRADSLPEAQAILGRWFPDAVLRTIPASAPDDVRVQIVLGADFATSSPSP